MTALQPLLVAVAIAFVLALVAMVAVRGISALNASRSSAIWAASALAPLSIAALAVVAVLSPDGLSRLCHCAVHGAHHPHLCWTHPGFAGPLVVPALIAIGVVCVLRGPAIARAVRGIVHSSRLFRDVRSAPITEIDGIEVHLLDCGEPTAFTAGVLSPRIVVDRTLGEQLDAQSLRAVVHHEHAHAIRRDGLTLCALRLSAAWLPGLKGVVQGWIAASEAECDRHAAGILGSAADVAAALVAVERLRARRTTPSARFAPAIASPDPNDVKRRVHALLDSRDPRSPSLASDVLSVTIVVAGLIVLAALWPGDAIHHLAETLLGFAFHH